MTLFQCYSQRWSSYVDSNFLFNQITALKQHWVIKIESIVITIKIVILSTLFQRCFANVEGASINIGGLNFHFKPNFNVETRLVHRRWIDVILLMFFQRCFTNVKITSINVHRLNFYFQPNINFGTTLINVDD